MGTTPNLSLPLSLIVPVTVTVSPAGSPGLTFNQGLIVGSSAVIPSVGANSRIREYFSLTGMTQDGFTTTEPEYLAMELYFGQTPTPAVGWVGRQDLTAIAQVTATSGNLGTGYVVGDVLTVTQSMASGGKLTVTNIGASGAIAYETPTGTASSGSTTLTLSSATGVQVGMTVTGTGIPAGTTITMLVSTTATLSEPTTAILSTTPLVISGLAVLAGGTGYSDANSLSTTGGTGSGAEVDIIAVGETPLQAIQACRQATPLWYSCMYVGGAADSDYTAIAAYIEAIQPASTFFLTSGEAAILNGTSGNLFATLQALNYKRTFCVYSTTQSGAFPNNIYASAGVMGLAMALNTESAGSYFTMAYKLIAGVAAEPLTQTQVATICGTFNRSSNGLNGNVLLLWQNGAYTFLMNGTMIGGQFFDITLNIDILVNLIQTNIVNLFVSEPSVPITDSGVNQVKAVIQEAVVDLQTIGFIAPVGTWLGPNIGTGAQAILNGEALPAGYEIYAPSVSTLTQGQRAARQLPPITVLIILAESAQSVAIPLTVQL